MKNERGMTMVELMVALAVTGVIVSFLGTAVYQIITISGEGSGRLTALHELQNASRWFQADVQQAVSASAGTSLTLTLSDNSTVSYTLVGTELRRTTGSDLLQADIKEVVDAGAEVSFTLTLSKDLTVSETAVVTELSSKAGSQMTLARNITSATFSYSAPVVTMDLVAAPSGRYGVSESASYQAALRPEGGG